MTTTPRIVGVWKEFGMAHAHINTDGTVTESTTVPVEFLHKADAALAAAQQRVRELEDEHETTLIALGNMTAAWDRQMNEIAELKADNARLREIVERLPVTADGVVVIPRWDEELWHPEYGECEPYRSNDDRWIVFSDCDRTGIRPFGLVSDCYSTREAAEAAREVQS